MAASCGEGSDGRSAAVGPQVVRFAIAAILLVAAVLKTHQLATEPVLGVGLLESRWFLVAVIEFELFLAFWLVSGVFQRAVWCVSLGVFSTFAVVAAIKGLSGEASCGCFGRVPTSPWFALAIDLSAAAALLWFRPHALLGSSPPRALGSGLDGSPRVATVPLTAAHKRLLALLGMWLVVGLSLGTVAGRGPSRDPLAVIGQRVGNTVVVEPERMVGQPFELGRYIDIGSRLAQGRWLLLLHRTGCNQCGSLLRHLRDDVPHRDIGADLAIISISAPRASDPAIDAPVAAHGALAAGWDWLVPTPCLLDLADGHVLGVYRSLEDALHAMRWAPPSDEKLSPRTGRDCGPACVYLV